jgi:hypothetical protein
VRAKVFPFYSVNVQEQLFSPSSVWRFISIKIHVLSWKMTARWIQAGCLSIHHFLKMCIVATVLERAQVTVFQHQYVNRNRAAGGDLEVLWDRVGLQISYSSSNKNLNTTQQRLRLAGS